MEQPIHIAHVIGKLNAAGVEAVVNNYYRYLNHERFQFDYIIDEDSKCLPPEELLKLGAHYFTVPPYQQLPRYIKNLENLFRKNAYPVVHASLNSLSVFPLYAAARVGVPVRINHNHSTAGKGELKRNLMKRALKPFASRYATELCACSRYAAAWLFGESAVQSRRVTIFNNAIDLERFSFSESARAEVRQEFGLGKRFVMGHVGRFCYQKNHDFLIDSFCALKRYRPDAALLLIGIGEEQDRIRKKTRELGLAEDVLFLGVRKDVDRLYSAMDVFVLPSRYEGLPVVAVEAQACGLPCVLSNEMTKETLLIPEAQMLSLDASPIAWAEKIAAAGPVIRRQTADELRAAGFDIRCEAQKLEQFYIDAIRRHQNG